MTGNGLPNFRIGDHPMRGSKQIQRDIRTGRNRGTAGQSSGRFPQFPPLGFGPIPSYR